MLLLYTIWFAAFLIAYAILQRFDALQKQPAFPTGSKTNFRSPISLVQAAGLFFRYPYVWVLTLSASGYLAAKLYIGDWRWPQIIFAAGILTAWPLVEWAVHHYILHARSIRIFGRTLDMQSPAHLLHHRSPWHLRYTLGPNSSLAVFCLGVPLIWHLIFPVRGALLFSALTTLLVLNYEWIHFLIHTSYRPRTWFYRRLWVNHRLHHFKNEGYWFGVTMLSGDVLLRTSPRARDVPHSPNALTLASKPKSTPVS